MLVSLVAVQTGCAAAPPPKAAMSPPAAYAAPSAPAADVPVDAQASIAPPPPAPAAAPAPGSAPAQAPARSPAPPPPAAPAKASAPAAAAPKPADARSAKNAGPTTRAAVIIYEGDMKMTADEEAVPKTIDKIIDIAEGLGGNLAARKDTSVTIKVPSPSFREAMTKIDGLGGVTSRSVKADDVSEEFHDLEVRLANMKATRARLQEFLAKAGDIPNMLTVERELERVAQEIDRIEGRLEFLRTRAAMSVITVAITPKIKERPVVSTTTTSAAQGPDLPIPWVSSVGIDKLLSLKK